MNLGLLFPSDVRTEHEMDRLFGTGSAVIRKLYRKTVAKRELSWKAELSGYQSIYVPTLIYVALTSK